MPPWKPYYNPVGSTVDNLEEFCKSLFDTGTQEAFREQFFTLTTEKDLREVLADNKIVIPPTDVITGAPIRIMVVDVENARCVSYGAKIDPKNELFYLLVMPPVPRKYDRDMQAWESAWYHAIADGFGM
jgi:hypothetical protein